MNINFCIQCGVEANAETFYLTGRGEFSSPYCKVCYRKKYPPSKSYHREYYQLNKKKLKARAKVNHAVSSKAIPAVNTQKCVKCGKTAEQYHHPRGYDDPLDVEPVCESCHRKLHKGNTSKPKRMKYWQRGLIKRCLLCGVGVNRLSFEFDEDHLPIYKYCKKCCARWNELTKEERKTINRNYSNLYMKWKRENPFLDK